MITIEETVDLSSSIYDDAITLRKEVFVLEQQVPIELELESEEKCIHFVLYENKEPLATVRLFPKENGLYKVQRMAVKHEARKKGFGRDIMIYVEEFEAYINSLYDNYADTGKYLEDNMKLPDKKEKAKLIEKKETK